MRLGMSIMLVKIIVLCVTSSQREFDACECHPEE